MKKTINTVYNFSANQKKWFSFVVAIVAVALASMLTGCGNKEVEQAAARQKATNDAAQIFLKQGNGHVRKWGEKPATPVSSSEKSQHAQK